MKGTGTGSRKVSREDSQSNKAGKAHGSYHITCASPASEALWVLFCVFEKNTVQFKSCKTVVPWVAISDLSGFSQALHPKWTLWKRWHLGSNARLNRKLSSWKNWRHLWKANNWLSQEWHLSQALPTCLKLQLVNQINLWLLQFNLSVALFTT